MRRVITVLTSFLLLTSVFIVVLVDVQAGNEVELPSSQPSGDELANLEESVVLTATDEYNLTINIEGEGDVYLDCNFTYGDDENEYIIPEGENVTLYASANYSWVFIRWKGDVESEKKEIEFVMDSDKEITVVFKLSIEITQPEENGTQRGRNIEVEWVIRAESSSYTHVVIRKNENNSWRRIGDREAWMFYNVEEGDYNISVRLIDGRTEIGRDGVSMEFEEVDWYESVPVWEFLFIMVLMSLVCGVGRLVKNARMGRRSRRKY